MEESIKFNFEKIYYCYLFPLVSFCFISFIFATNYMIPLSQLSEQCHYNYLLDKALYLNN